MFAAAQKVFHLTLQNGLLLSELSHGLAAIPFAFFLWQKTKSWRNILVFYLVIYLIDSDHFIEYFQVYGLTFDPLTFFNVDYFRTLGRTILPFHAWEWVIALGCLTKDKKWNYLPKTIMLGMVAHLLWDTISNGFPFTFYFITSRILHGFALPT